MTRKSLNAVVYATILALTVVLSWVPYGGVFLLPILLCVCCFGYTESFVASLMFGLVSVAYAFMLPGSVFAIGAIFRQFPWIAIVPRLFIGPVAHTVYILMKRLLKERGIAGKIIPISVSAVVGTVTNTVLVGLCIFLAGRYIDPAMTTLSLIELVVAGSIEVAVMAVVTPSVVLAVKRAMPRLFAEINSKRHRQQVMSDRAAQEPQQDSQGELRQESQQESQEEKSTR